MAMRTHRFLGANHGFFTLQRTHPLRGFDRRANFLENEFKKVTKTLDDFRRRSIVPNVQRLEDAGIGSTSLKRAPTDPQPPPQLPPMIAKLARESSHERDAEDEDDDGLVSFLRS
jgi:hypothetical protein